MSLQTDIQEYISASLALNELYRDIEGSRKTAIERRNERWAANKRKRVAAENVIMSMIGEHKPALQRAGILKFYEEMSAGQHDTAMVEIVDATCKHYAGSLA